MFRLDSFETVIVYFWLIYTILHIILLKKSAMTRTSKGELFYEGKEIYS